MWSLQYIPTILSGTVQFSDKVCLCVVSYHYTVNSDFTKYIISALPGF